MHIGMVLSKYKDKYVINLLQLDIMNNMNSSNTQVVEHIAWCYESAITLCCIIIT